MIFIYLTNYCKWSWSEFLGPTNFPPKNCILKWLLGEKVDYLRVKIKQLYRLCLDDNKWVFSCPGSYAMLSNEPFSSVNEAPHRPAQSVTWGSLVTLDEWLYGVLIHALLVRWSLPATFLFVLLLSRDQATLHFRGSQLGRLLSTERGGGGRTTKNQPF